VASPAVIRNFRRFTDDNERPSPYASELRGSRLQTILFLIVSKDALCHPLTAGKVACG
jgi:hypothetical protein